MAQAPDGLVLRFPDSLPPHSTLTYESAVQLLLKAMTLAERSPFSWGYIDQPPDGSIFLVFVTSPLTFVADGLRFQEADTRYVIPAAPSGGPPRELEVYETKHGFIPGGKDNTANRCRKRFRLSKGGHPQLALYYYTRGPAVAIVPSLMNNPVRQYPLRPPNDSHIGVYVVGAKAGQKVSLAAGMNAPPAVGGMPPVGPHAQVVAQNHRMEETERRRMMEQQQRARAQQPYPQPAGRRGIKDDEEEEEETEHISTRTLALTRYKRNHELMDEIFMYAAFGEKVFPHEPESSVIFDETQIKTQIDKVEKEVHELQARKSAKKAINASQTSVDTSMSFEMAVSV